MELTGRGDYIQPLIQSIKLRNTLPARRSNDFVALRKSLMRRWIEKSAGNNAQLIKGNVIWTSQIAPSDNVRKGGRYF
jgi:hypothetical protein